MKYVSLVLLVLVSSISHAGWKEKLSCDSSRAVVDFDISATDPSSVSYQLVIREPSAVEQLSQQLDLNRFVNQSGELVVPVFVIPADSSYNRALTYAGNLSSGLVEAFREGNGLRVQVVRIEYHGRTRRVVANWYFNACTIN
jgi:hypothetical protein